MDYRQFSAVDLATDSAFIAWVQRPDAANSAFWEGYLAQSPDRAEVVAEARQLVAGWQLNNPIPSESSRNAVWMKIQSGLSLEPEQPVIPLTRPFWGRPQFMRYAAVLLGLLVLAAATVWMSERWNKTYYSTGKGETKTVALSDGSTVILAANSSISVTGDWTPEHPRELLLKGEAFFSVTHQKNHQKFIVNTPDHLRVEVLGTTFTVTERATKTQVVLNSGKVALYLSKNARPLFMKPGELVEIPKTRQQPVVRRKVTPEVYSAWTDNQFVFENTSLDEIAAIIETDFGYKVQFSDDLLKDRRVTLRLPDRDLSLLLTSLSEIHDLTIDRQPNRILISETPATTPE